LAIAVAALTFAVPSSSGQSRESKHDFFLVDVSGSMRGTPLKHRKLVLKEWITEHPAASITLMSFGKGILSSRDFHLNQTDQYQEALHWVDSLRIEPGLYSYVWDSCRIVLNVASDIQKNPDRPMTLHVLTDALDNQGFGDLETVLRDFHNARRETPTPVGTTDFTITLAAAVASPSPTAGVVAGPTATATPTATPTATATPKATATATATPSATPKTTATATATATPKVTPTATPTATPCSSVSPCDAKAFFEIQEARVVADGQLVHFINRTTPPATSYLWRLERNWGDKETVKRQPDENERTSDATHFVHRFQPAGPGPRSYTITLQADYNGIRVDAAPVTVLVPGEGDFWASVWSNVKLFFANLAQVATGILAVVSAFVAIWEKLKRPKPDPSTPWAPELSRRVQPWPWRWIIAFLAFTSLFFVLASNRPSVTNLWRQSPPPVVEGELPRPVPVPVDQPSIDVRTDQPIFGKVLIGILLVGGTLVAVLALLRFVQSGGLNSKNLSPLLPTDRTEPSFAARLDEIERLCQAQVIPAAELSTLKSVLFNQLKQKYGLEGFASIRPRLTDDLKKLIEALTDSTVDGITKWKIKPPTTGNPTTPESEPRETEPLPPMRFYCVIPPDEPAKEPTDSSAGTKTPADDPRVEAATDGKATVRTRIEIYADQTGFGIDIANNAGEVIESINRGTFLLSGRTLLQIAKLFRLAKNSGLEIAENVQAAVDLLEAKIEAAKAEAAKSAPPLKPS
jgi:hypothetical protein